MTRNGGGAKRARLLPAVQPNEHLDLVTLFRKVQLSAVCVAVEVKQRVDRNGPHFGAGQFYVGCCDAFFSFGNMDPVRTRVVRKHNFQPTQAQMPLEQTLLRRRRAGLLAQRPYKRAY